MESSFIVYVHIFALSIYCKNHNFGVTIMVLGLVDSLLRHRNAVWRFIRLSVSLVSGGYMRHQEVDNYLIAILPTYETACKTEKGKLLDHAQLVTKRSRKRLIKRLRELKANKCVFRLNGPPFRFKRATSERSDVAVRSGAT